MRKLLYLGFCLVLVMGVGCAITNYALITDNDQVDGGSGNNVVNTNGKAHIVETSKWAFLFGGGGAEEWISFVDQQADGDRTLTNYGHATPAGGTGTFHDDLYCNPDWTGCAAWTSDDPETGDVDVFDGSQNVSCTVSGVFSVLVSTGRTGECGRAGLQQASISDQIALLSMGELGHYQGREGLWYNLTPANTTLMVNNSAISLSPMSVFVEMRGTDRVNGLIDVSNPLTAFALRQIGNAWQQGTVVDQFSLIYNGIQVFVGDGSMKLVGNLDRAANNL